MLPGQSTPVTGARGIPHPKATSSDIHSPQWCDNGKGQKPRSIRILKANRSPTDSQQASGTRVPHLQGCMLCHAWERSQKGTLSTTENTADPNPNPHQPQGACRSRVSAALTSECGQMCNTSTENQHSTEIKRENVRCSACSPPQPPKCGEGIWPSR